MSKYFSLQQFITTIFVILLLKIFLWDSLLLPHSSAEFERVLKNYSELITMFATIAIAWFTLELKAVTKKLSDAEHPHLIPLSQEFKLNELRNTDPSVEVLNWNFKFKNSGRTTAFATCLKFGAGPGPALPSEKAELTSSIDLYIIIPPNTFLNPAKPGTIDMPLTLRQDILLGITKLFIHGCIEFEDISGDKHFQNFAFRFEPGADESKDVFFPCGPRCYWAHS